ncbi:hypothetical protein AWB85_15470 [Mycobacteroides immunogenum]|uniref:FAD-binding domain-containing protein n=1 Tax=Mycobacteroides immunogenum TaxID=83262 RepID=A0A179V517_9MYCO|nr:hypothetical protein AWB85_15470 [Mycobacteroides immunogenum]
MYEQSGRLGEVGGPLGISPVTLRLFERWGLLADFEAMSSPTRFLEERNQVGRVELVIDFTALDAKHSEQGEFGYADLELPPRTVHRADLHRLMVGHVPSSRFRMNHRLESISERDKYVELRFSNGVATRAGLVIGADGIHSRIRRMFSTDKKRYCGSVIFRSVSPAASLVTLPNDRLRTWTSGGGSRSTILMPVRAGRQVSIDATLGVDEPPAQLWSAQANVEALARQFDDFDPVVPRVIRSSINKVFMHPVYDRDPIRVWTSPRIALVGDAAHPMTPFGGHGANQAVQDGAVLADQIFSVHPGAYPEALRRYQAIRTRETAAIQQASREAADRQTRVAVRLSDILLS